MQIATTLLEHPTGADPGRPPGFQPSWRIAKAHATRFKPHLSFAFRLRTEVPTGHTLTGGALVV